MIKKYFLFFLLLLLLSCDTSIFQEDLLNYLEEARSNWENQNIHNYDMTIDFVYYEDKNDNYNKYFQQDFTVTNETSLTADYSFLDDDEEEVAKKYGKPINKIFDMIEKDIQEDPEIIDIEYDKTDYYPKAIRIVFNKKRMNTSYELNITSFTAN